MDSSERFDMVIVGGGLAGLTAANHLSNSGLRIVLIEKYEYPHHKVCGEYVSNEVMPYLKSLGLDPFKKGAVAISNFEISTKDGEKVTARLPLGGIGISRYALDLLLFDAVKEKVTVVFGTVETVEFENNHFSVRTIERETYKGDFVLGAFGKRSLVDTTMKRAFMQQKSPWLAVKAHYNYDFPSDTVALHNFEGGYCGLSQIETGAVNACYLTTYKSFKRIGHIESFQKEILSQNPHLNTFFDTAELLFENPLTISQISFEKKQPVEEHIFMIGDSAGLIHPLCGNGMAIAIHSAKLFCELFLKALAEPQLDREVLEQAYRISWEETFTKRLQMGRRIQNLLLHPATANLGLKIVQTFPSLIPKIIKKTHGDLLV
jgi:flavin-dependent dehydrogenase